MKKFDSEIVVINELLMTHERIQQYKQEISIKVIKQFVQPSEHVKWRTILYGLEYFEFDS